MDGSFHQVLPFQVIGSIIFIPRRQNDVLPRSRSYFGKSGADSSTKSFICWPMARVQMVLSSRIFHHGHINNMVAYFKNDDLSAIIHTYEGGGYCCCPAGERNKGMNSCCLLRNWNIDMKPSNDLIKLLQFARMYAYTGYQCHPWQHTVWLLCMVFWQASTDHITG